MPIHPPGVQRDDPLAILEARLRDLERVTCGPWVYVGNYPGTPGTTPDSPPFEGLWSGTVRFRWLRDLGIELQGGPGGGDVGETIFFTPNSPFYRPDIDLHFIAASASFAPVYMALLTTGAVVYEA